MKLSKLVVVLFVLPIIFLFSTFTLFAFQVASVAKDNSLKTLDLNDLDKWEGISGSGVISNDGKWLIYSVSNNDRKSEGRLHNLTNDKVKTMEEAGVFRFSNDNKWLGFMVAPDRKTQDKLREEKKPIVRKFGLLNLATDETVYINDADYFDFSGDGKFVVIKKPIPEKSEAKTVNIIIRDLTKNKDRVFGNVKDFAWSENGMLLAFTTETTDKIGNSVMLFDSRTQTTQILDTKEAAYSDLGWRRKSEDLVVLRSTEDKAFSEDNREILVWRGLANANAVSQSFNPTNVTNFPKDLKIPEKNFLRWSLDGKSLFFSIDERKKQEGKKDEKASKDEKESKEKDKKLPEIPGLEIWNAGDVETIPEQKLKTRKDPYTSVWHTESNKFVRLEDGSATLSFQNNSPILVATNDKPYDFDKMFGRPSYDVYSVDTNSGVKKKILTDNPANLFNSVSPGGKYFVYLRDNNYHLYDFATAKDINLTKNIDDSFVDLDDDHPVRQKNPYSFVGWDEKATYFIVHSKFDIWKFDAANGKGTRVSNGKATNTQYRFERIDFRQPHIDLNLPYLLRRFETETKKMGYSYVENGKTRELTWGESATSGTIKAKNAETIALKIESYNDSPDYFVLPAASSMPKQVSKINPFEKDYKLGKAEVVQFTNAKGQKLQGSLYYPDDYDPAKKHPMITYIYELLSDGFYRYTTPSNTNYYNRRVFTSQGYFFFMPDIVFEPGDPGVSSVKTLEIAVKAVVDKGLVDEKRVGLVGHSWGGYQAAYAVTRTNIFAASVAGAGISNLLTMYGTLTPAFGSTFESKHFEVGQERMIVPPWKDIEGYLRNSAIPNISKMQTPLLMEAGDADKNVNWGQALEMYNAARREKKPMVLLVYANEGHGLREPKNQIDYQKRILEWFGHYLKNEPAKKWIKDNIPYSDQQKLLKDRELE